MRTSKTIAALGVALLGLACWSLTAGSARGVVAEETLCVVTHVDVMPKFTAEGRELLRQFAAASRKDAGSVSIDVFEELSRPNHSTVVESWKTRQAYEDHLSLDHVRAYRGKLQPMLGSPFDERLHRPSR
jgi:quinol monooxygenase YgiN